MWSPLGPLGVRVGSVVGVGSVLVLIHHPTCTPLPNSTWHKDHEPHLHSHNVCTPLHPLLPHSDELHRDLAFLHTSLGNHLEERLLDQAQVRTPYTPFFGGHSRSIPQGMILDVQPLVKSLFCPIKQSPNGFFYFEALFGHLGGGGGMGGWGGGSKVCG